MESPIEELLDGCEEVDESKRDTSTKMSTAVEKALGRTHSKATSPKPPIRLWLGVRVIGSLGP